MTVLIAQLTDTHVVDPDADGRVPDEVYVDNNHRLASAVASLNAERPAIAVVLGTGDLTNGARPGEYERLAELLAPLTVPLLALPGNHDDRDLLRATFPTTPWIDAEHASWVTIVGTGDERVRVVGLDSTIPGAPGAAFDDEREAWLRSVLAEHARRCDDARPAPSAVRHGRGLDGRLRLRRAPVGSRRCSPITRSTRWCAGTSTDRCRRWSRGYRCRSACRRCSTSTSTSRRAPPSA